MVRFALVGGNSNNGLNSGGFYSNLGNSVGNRNWNIGAAHSYVKPSQCTMFSLPLGKNDIDSKHLLVSGNTQSG